MLPEKSKKESSCVEYGQSKHTKAVVVGLSACILCCFFHSVYLLYTWYSQSQIPIWNLVLEYLPSNLKYPIIDSFFKICITLLFKNSCSINPKWIMMCPDCTAHASNIMRNYTWEIDILWTELRNLWLGSYKIFCVCPDQPIFEFWGFNPYLRLMKTVPNISYYTRWIHTTLCARLFFPLIKKTEE